MSQAITRKEPPQESFDDHDVYIHVEDAKANIPWKLGNYENGGVFTKRQIDELSARFGLPWRVLCRLSKMLGHCLEVKDVSIKLARLRKSKAMERGQTTLRRAGRRLRKAEARLDEAVEAGKSVLEASSFAAEALSHINWIRGELDFFTTAFFTTIEDARNFEKARESLRRAAFRVECHIEKLIACLDTGGDRETAHTHARRARDTLSGLRSELESLPQVSGPLADIRAVDKRKVWDKRRQYVVESCCHAWEDGQKRVTYWTDPSAEAGNRRRGALPDFIEAIVAMITAPPFRLSEETLRKDIDRFMQMPPEDAFMREPPRKG